MAFKNDDILKGVEQIANYLDEKPGVVRASLAAKKIPHWRTGALYRARKSTLDNWREQQERAAIQPG